MELFFFAYFIKIIRESNMPYVHTINPHIATHIGESESILLNQLDYWISKCGHDIDNLDGKWIYNSYEKWSEQFTYWSISKLRRTIKSLENLGLIKSTKVNSKKWNQTKWYTIDYEKYAKLLKHIKQKHSFFKNATPTKEGSVLDQDLKPNLKLLDNYLLAQNNLDQDPTNTSKANGLNNNNQPPSNIDYFSKMQEEEHTTQQELNAYGEVATKSKNIQKSPEVCICSKWTNRIVQNEQMLIVTKNSYTKNNSSNDKLLLNKARGEDIYIDSKKEKEIVNQMINEWNTIFEYSLKPIKAYSNEKIVARLNKAYKEIFNSSMDNWIEYAIKVSSSRFLMGEKKTKKDFKATFVWLSKLDTMQMILSGEYGVGDRKPDIDNLSDNLKIQRREIEDSIAEKITNSISDEIDIKKEKGKFKEYLLTQAKNDKYGIHKELGKKYNMGKYADTGRFMHNIYSIFNTEYKYIYDLCFEEYLLKRHGNTNKESIVEKVTDILASFYEENSLLALQKMKKFQDLVSRGWEGKILKKIEDI
jgi:hypothetical protein